MLHLESTHSEVYECTEMEPKALALWKKYATGGSGQRPLTLSLSNGGISLTDVASMIKATDLGGVLEREEKRWLADIERIIEIYRNTELTKAVLGQERTAVESSA